MSARRREWRNYGNPSIITSDIVIGGTTVLLHQNGPVPEDGRLLWNLTCLDININSKVIGPCTLQEAQAYAECFVAFEIGRLYAVTGNMARAVHARCAVEYEG